MTRDILLGELVEKDTRLQLSPEEKARIEKLAILEMKATRGDVPSQKKIVLVNAALNSLQKKASKGDARSIRILATLQESGLVQQIAAASKKAAPRLTMAGNTESGYNGHLAYIKGLGEEAVALAFDGGSAERASLLRRRARS